MYGGYAGKILRIDLSNQKIDIQQLDENLIKEYIGGSGIGTKFLYDETNKKADPLSAKNLLIFMTGPLTSSGVPETGRHEIIFKSPLTNLFARSDVGGTWGVQLKKSGFDGIIISGKSEKPVYLWINNEEVKFREASHLWGKDTYESDEILKKETTHKASIAVIGPAGEKRIRISSINHDGKYALHVLQQDVVVEP